jgi:L-serine deaminase
MIKHSKEALSHEPGLIVKDVTTYIEDRNLRREALSYHNNINGEA